MRYNTQADRMDWEKIRFGTHTAEECKSQWNLIITKVNVIPRIYIPSQTGRIFLSVKEKPILNREMLNLRSLHYIDS